MSTKSHSAGLFGLIFLLSLSVATPSGAATFFWENFHLAAAILLLFAITIPARAATCFYENFDAATDGSNSSIGRSTVTANFAFATGTNLPAVNTSVPTQ